MSLDAIPTTDLFDTFTKTLCVGYDNVTLTRHSLVGRLGIMVDPNLARNIKESIYIRVNNPSLNNNIGQFNLSHIWDRVLLNTNGLSLK